MRQKLNENPVAQIAVIAVLLIAGGYLLLTQVMGGGESAAESPTSTTVSAPAEAATAEAAATPAAEAGTAEAAGASAGAASAPSERRLPHAVEAAYASGATIVLLIVHEGGIDDRLVSEAAGVLQGMPGVALFTASVREIARYAPITGPLGVNQAPALIVVRPRHLNGGAPAPATVTYGFQSASDIRQAVRDATYEGPELTYAPN
jgi:hypothetical protein